MVILVQLDRPEELGERVLQVLQVLPAGPDQLVGQDQLAQQAQLVQQGQWVILDQRVMPDQLAT